jgi:hypothetical protein
MSDHDVADMDKQTDAQLREGIEKAETIQPESEAAEQKQEEQKHAMEDELSERQQ